MHRYAESWRFGAERVADDAVHYNLQFDAYQDALPAWRYPDMTDHVEYLAEVVQRTIEEEMRKEAGYLRGLRNARERAAAGHRGSVGAARKCLSAGASATRNACCWEWSEASASQTLG